MEDWLKCQISSLVKYRQNQKPKYVEQITYLELQTSDCTGNVW